MRLTPDRAHRLWSLWQWQRILSYWSLGPVRWRDWSRYFD